MSKRAEIERTERAIYLWSLALVGLIGSLVVAVLAISSFDPVRRRRGSRAWKRLHRWPLVTALVGTALVGLPFLFGLGLDAPDDLLYHGIIPWEWLQTAWADDLSPWLVPSTMGGSNLLSDAIYMGPFYPASWSVLLLPVSLAYPLVCLLHALGGVLATRWLARLIGASELASCLAGAAIGIGPIGAMGFIDGRAAQWPVVLWLPLAFACLEMTRRTQPRFKRAAWTCAAGGAIALMLLGTHLRMGAAAGGTMVLWALLSRLPRGTVLAALVLGVLGGSPSLIPLLYDWREASSGAGLLELLAMMGGPASGGIHWDNLSGWLVSSPTIQKPDYGVGVILGVALVAGLGRGRLAWSTPAGRMSLLWLGVAGTVFVASIPGLRYLTAPLLLLTHPVNDVYLLAIAPLVAATAALALDSCLRRWSQPGESSLGQRKAPVIPVFLGLALLLIVVPRGHINHPWTLTLYVLGWFRVAATLGLLSRAAKGRVPGPWIFSLGIAELGLYALGLHLVVPSQPVDLRARSGFDAGELRAGYVDLADLGNLSEFRFVVKDTGEGPAYPFSGEFPDYRDFALSTQQLMNDRTVPVGLAMARGYRALSGEHKMLPEREALALRAIVELIPDEEPVTDALLEGMVARGSPASRMIALHGLRYVVGPNSQREVREKIAPLCYSPTSVEVVADPAQRLKRLENQTFAPEGPALLESPLTATATALCSAELSCEDARSVTLRASCPALVVINERHHPGWTVRGTDGQIYPPQPVNQIHLGVLVPAGEHKLELRFTPPGLVFALRLAVLAWCVILSGVSLPLARRRLDPSSSQNSP